MLSCQHELNLQLAVGKRLQACIDAMRNRGDRRRNQQTRQMTECSQELTAKCHNQLSYRPLIPIQLKLVFSSVNISPWGKALESCSSLGCGSSNPDILIAGKAIVHLAPTGEQWDKLRPSPPEARGYSGFRGLVLGASGTGQVVVEVAGQALSSV